MKNKGKNYFTRNCFRPGDLYYTPFSLVWELLKYEDFENCLEPASGEGAIIKAAKNYDNCEFIREGDIKKGEDFFDSKSWHGDILTNPPFSLWDGFVFHAKKITDGKICMLGKLNYFGCVGRYKSGIWDGLKTVYIFNRYVDYRTPYREDGLFHVGGMATAWFVWDRDQNPINIPEIRILDVQKYAKLGQFKNEL